MTNTLIRKPGIGLTETKSDTISGIKNTDSIMNLLVNGWIEYLVENLNYDN